MLREENWKRHYEELKAFVRSNGHYPPRDSQLYNWCRYNTKLKNRGKMDDKKAALMTAVEALRKKVHEKKMLEKAKRLAEKKKAKK